MYQLSPYVNENFEFLQKLAVTKSDKRKNKLLLNSTADQILAIVEICANVLKFNFPLSVKQRQKLSKYAEFYRSLGRVRTEKTARKRLQQGSGVALAAILVPVISALAQIAIDRIKK